MSTSLSGSGRHRRRIRLALPVAATGLVAAVAAALLTSSANAAPSATPHVKPAMTSPSLSELQQRVSGALATDAAMGKKTTKSSKTTSGTGSSTSTSTSTSGSTISPMVIGGTDTAITSAPFMAQLWYYDDKGTTDTSDDVSFFCGGTVVSPTKILTASHCVKGFNWHAYGAIITGTNQLPTTNSDGSTDLHGGTVSGVWRQWNHPSYTTTTNGAPDNDIAVLTLPNPVKATPVRMTTSTDTASYAGGTVATLYGWGRTSSTSNDIAQTLQSAQLTIHADSTCTTAYGSDYVAGHMVCAGTQSGSDTGTKASCNGDSGGPLIVNNRIVGVVSWGVENCVAKGDYSVFTKVRSYVGAAYPRIDDTNLSGDSKADLFLRNSSTKTGYELDSKGTSLASRISWGSFSGYNVILQTDLNRDGYQDFILRSSSTGAVYWEHYVPAGSSWTKTQIFSNWSTRTRIVAPGDVTGDYKPDLLSVDSGGTLWIYPGKGDGTFGTPVSVGTGWNQYNALLGHGDFNGDGKADLIARQKSTGYIYLYRGTGTAGSGAFSSRINVRTWSTTTYNTLDAVGDVTGDGKADFLARTPGGTLYLYPGTGQASSGIFATRVSLGTGFQQYDLLG
ncbi:trypsin-like serine protease [Streptomyces sp. NPDC051172]|uniref:trypsin-like serine protease n=1 Tax=Streptomyces sp. NPDC051172 TaxID=3155796 RepID=UPI0034454F33